MSRTTTSASYPLRTQRRGRQAAFLSSFLLAVTLPSLLAAQEPGSYGHYEVYDIDLPPRAEYAARRARARAAMPKGSAMLLRSADVRNRSNDVDYEYRQRNSLLYLSGVTEQESALLLLPEMTVIGGVKVDEILFVRKRDEAEETWTGILMGPDVAADVTGIATTLPYDEMESTLTSLMPTITTLYYDDWLADELVEPLIGVEIEWDDLFEEAIEEMGGRVRIVRANEIIDPLRAIKSPTEIALLQRAVDISIEAHRATIRAAEPGDAEYEMEATMEYTFRALGAEDPGYPSIVGSGPNTCILHYSTNRRRTEAGDLVLMDCGAEYHGYSADITRTFPVSGRFTKEQRAIYDLVLRAQSEAIAKCRDGASFFDPHVTAAGIIADGLVELGIMREGDDVSRYFMHGTSHYLGLDVHDVAPTFKLAAGMVLTVEPGIYIPEGSPCDEKWWNIGVRIEDDIVVTDGEPLNLSAKLERTAGEIEALMEERE